MSEPEFHALVGDGLVPNNAHCAAAHYKGVFETASPESLAQCFEQLFAKNLWPPAWRNGIFSHHHFHTTAHEVLGIYSGRAEVQLGGEKGPVVSIHAGDVVVVPAGVGHCKLDCDGQLGVAAAYPAGQSADLQTPDAKAYEQFTQRVVLVELPALDPVLGADGPLTQRWQRPENVS